MRQLITNAQRRPECACSIIIPSIAFFVLTGLSRDSLKNGSKREPGYARIFHSHHESGNQEIRASSNDSNPDAFAIQYSHKQATINQSSKQSIE